MNCTAETNSDVLNVIPAGGRSYRIGKRLIDILLSLFFLMLLFPLMLLTGIIIKLTSPGDVFFRQQRAGQDGQPFTMLKFRTMIQGAEDDRDLIDHLNEADGPVFKIRHDPRMTRLGKLLRQTSIDELPQLWNVLRGEMSIVGPRPLWLPEAQKTNGTAKARAKVKPGLTCLWQICGRSELDYQQWVALDLFYLQKRSFWLDWLIILRTFPAVLSARGAY